MRRVALGRGRQSGSWHDVGTRYRKLPVCHAVQGNEYTSVLLPHSRGGLDDWAGMLHPSQQTGAGSKRKDATESDALLSHRVVAASKRVVPHAIATRGGFRPDRACHGMAAVPAGRRRFVALLAGTDM